MVKNMYGTVPKLGQCQFLQLYVAFNPTIDEITTLCNMIAIQSQKYYNSTFYLIILD